MQTTLLPTRNRVRTDSWSWEYRPTSLWIPSELLSTNLSCAPTNEVVVHAVVDDPPFTVIWTLHEAGVTYTIYFFGIIFVEDTSRIVLGP